ncbi:MAG: mandelate racemase/muconate lactonizing enzyme family protein [Gammaproteobacteria bacterium]|nr:mandelate racemase/muconate lactonizing enzyme family protein [Gammaproteobacteria bacterium]
MQIAAIDVFQVDLPYAGGVYRLSGGREYQSFDATLVRITTDQGIEGWGESTPFGSTYVAAHAAGVRAGIDEIAPHLLGQDPRQVERVNDRVNQALMGHPHAKCALDVACWDIWGQASEMPVCDLLGGRTAARLPLISSIHAGTPDDMRDRVQAFRQRDYRGHSIKVGASEAEGGPALDAERIQSALADRQKGEFFIVDANGGMTVEQCLRLIQLLPAGLDFVLEAPCRTWRETLSLRQRCSIPVFWDELIDSDVAVMSMIAEDGGDGIGLKPCKNGGLTQCRRQRDIALAGGLAMSVQDTVGSEVAFAAVVHLAQSVPTAHLRCVLDTRDMVSLSTAAFDCAIEDGGVRAPSTPGLGITPNMAVLGEPVRTFH